MAITLDELLGMNTKTRNDEQPIDRFPSYDDFARRTRSIQNDDRTSYNGFTSAPQSSGARSVEFLREHEAARPYTRPSQSEYQNYEYNLDSLRARRQAPVATTYVEPIAVEESTVDFENGDGKDVNTVNATSEYAGGNKAFAKIDSPEAVDNVDLRIITVNRVSKHFCTNTVDAPVKKTVVLNDFNVMLSRYTSVVVAYPPVTIVTDVSSIIIRY